MELIYIFIEKYRNFENAELSLSGKFDIRYDKENGRIVINRNEKYQSIYPAHIRNINALVGRNSVGKTNIMDLIGMKIEDRNKNYDEYQTIYKHKKSFAYRIPDDIEREIWHAQYFMIYYLGEEGQDLFCIEGNNVKYIETMVENDIPEINYFAGKLWFNIICSNNNGKLRYIYNMNERLGDYRSEGIKIYGDYRTEGDKLAIISLRNNLNPEIYTNVSLRPEDDYKICIPRRVTRLQANQWVKKVDVLIKMMKSTQQNQRKIYSDKEYKLVISYTPNQFHKDIKSYKLSFGKIEKNNNHKCSLIESFLDYFCHFRLNDTNEAKARNLLMKCNYEINTYDEAIDAYREIANIIFEAAFEDIEYKKFVKERFNDFLNSLNNQYITVTGKSIEIPINSNTNMHNIKNVIDVLIDEDFRHVYFNDKFAMFSEFFECTIKNLSDGELHNLGLYASILEQIDDKNFSSGKENFILLFDEPETSMHPDLARNFINDIIEFLGGIANGRKFQIIISTHSPFILSDLQKENILLLEKDGDGISQIKKCDISTFGSNIHDILSNGFFMDSTIGEYEKNQINAVINDLYGIKRPRKADEDYMSESKIEYMISQIGEPILKNKLQTKFNEKYRADYENQNRQFLQMLDHIEKSPEGMLELKNRVDEYFRKRNNWGGGDTNE